MSLEVVLGLVAVVVGGLLGWFLRGKRKGNDTVPMLRPPGTEAKPVADAARELIRETADADRHEVEDVTSDPTPDTDRASLADIADARRRRREGRE